MIKRLEFYNRKVGIDAGKGSARQGFHVVDRMSGLQHERSHIHPLVFLDRTLVARGPLLQRDEVHQMILPAHVLVNRVLNYPDDFIVVS